MHISDIISSLQGITTATDGYTADMYDQQIHTKTDNRPANFGDNVFHKWIQNS